MALDPKIADAHQELGFAYRFHRKLKQSVSACRTALELNPNHHDAYQCLAMAKVALEVGQRHANFLASVLP